MALSLLKVLHNTFAPATVTYTSVRPDATNVAVTSLSGLQYPTEFREQAPSYAAYQGAYQTFIMDHTPFTTNSITPKARDTINDTVATYTVLSAQHVRPKAFWVISCVNLSLLGNFDDTITIQTATLALDAVGAQTRTWAAVHTSIAARIQPESVDVFDSRGIRATMTRYQVIVGSDVTVKNTAGDWGRILWVSNSNKVLDITGYRKNQRIDEFPVIDAIDEP